jgi:hypothetical protein
LTFFGAPPWWFDGLYRRTSFRRTGARNEKTMTEPRPPFPEVEREMGTVHIAHSSASVTAVRAWVDITAAKGPPECE